MSEIKFKVGRYLVTGGAGFIGSHLCETLLKHNCEVLSVDNFITGHRNNYLTFERNKKFAHRDQDISESFSVDGPLQGIFHMASPASPVDYQKFPIETLRAGALGSENVLKIAVIKKCPVVVASTSEIYGDPLEHPQKESYWGNVNTIGPRGCYDESKRYLEALTMAYHRVHKLPTRIVRIFNTYGPRMRMDDGRVVPNFCVQALCGKPITIYGDGKQTRSFCYVSDLVRGLMLRIQNDSPLPINLGNSTEFSIRTFAEKIIDLCKSHSKLSSIPLPEDDPKMRQPDITRAKEMLGWEPTVKLDDGLRLTLEFFQEKLKTPLSSTGS